jgi:hypothetical protein
MVDQSEDATWYADSGANHYLTPDLETLQLPAPYTGTDSIAVGNGSGLLITHTGLQSFTHLITFYICVVFFCVPKLLLIFCPLINFVRITIVFLSSLAPISSLRTIKRVTTRFFFFFETYKWIFTVARQHVAQPTYGTCPLTCT